MNTNYIVSTLRMIGANVARIRTVDLYPHFQAYIRLASTLGEWNVAVDMGSIIIGDTSMTYTHKERAYTCTMKMAWVNVKDNMSYAQIRTTVIVHE